jgi:hypothetical protein
MGEISLIVAEDKRFELLRPFRTLRAFQARPFSLLGNPPTTLKLYVLLNLITNEI